MASDQQKKDALDFVQQFRDRNPTGVWLNIRAGTFADGLAARINDPDLIDTGLVNLCGPGAFARFLAEDDPQGYARIGTDLLQTGQTVLMGRGPLAGRIVTAGYDLRSAPVPNVTYRRSDGTAGTLDPADWIILASVRDSDNWFFDYQDRSDAVSGITLPHSMEDWFRRAGYTTVLNETNVWFTKDRASAARASALRAQRYKVSLFIHSKMLSARDTDEGFWHGVGNFFSGPDEQGSPSWTPDHWVGLASDIHFTSGVNDFFAQVECRVHSWGQVVNIPADPSRPLNVRDFLQNYYGFIACKH